MRVFAIALLVAAAGCGSAPWPTDGAVTAMNAGLREIENGRAAAAVPHFELAVARAPDWYAAWANLAIARFHAGVLTPEFAERLLRDEPGHSHVMFVSGVMWKKAGDAERALEPLRRLASVETEDPRVACWLGLTLKDAGRTDEAEAALVRAVDLDPNLLPAKSALAVLRGEPLRESTGHRIGGPYANWSRFGRAIRRFPSVDRSPGSGENYIDLVLVPGVRGQTMEGPTCSNLEPGLEIRAGRGIYEGVRPGRILLGDQRRVDFVRVVWPGGRLTAHGPYDADQTITIRESAP